MSKNNKHSTICLNMIVKNEGSIIKQTLKNITQKLNIDYWVIHDTGSTDDTIEVIEEFFKEKNILGNITQDKWVNFAHNRNLALKNAQNLNYDYLFFFDADDTILGDPNLPEVLEHDCYMFTLTNPQGNISYHRPLLVNNKVKWEWYSVVHNFVSTKEKITNTHVNPTHCKIISGREGAQNKDPKKYSKQAQILKDEFFNEVNKNLLITRYAFYCAQSYKDDNNIKDAIKWYKIRTTLGGWEEEIYYSYLMLGKLLLKSNRENEALNSFIEGQNHSKTRVECYYELMKYYNSLKNYKMSYAMGLLAKKVKVNTNALFINPKVSRYLIDYELSLCCYYVGDLELGLKACKNILKQGPHIPEYETTLKNIEFYK